MHKFYFFSSLIITSFLICIPNACALTKERVFFIHDDFEPDGILALLVTIEGIQGSNKRIGLVTTAIEKEIDGYPLKASIAGFVLAEFGLAHVPVFNEKPFAGTSYVPLGPTAPARTYHPELDIRQFQVYSKRLEACIPAADIKTDPVAALIAGMESIDTASEELVLQILTDPSAIVDALNRRPDLASKIAEIHWAAGWSGDSKEGGSLTFNSIMSPLQAGKEDAARSARELYDIIAKHQIKTIYHSSHIIKTVFTGGSLNADNAGEFVETFLSSAANSVFFQSIHAHERTWTKHVVSSLNKVVASMKAAGKSENEWRRLQAIADTIAKYQFQMTPADALVALGSINSTQVVTNTRQIELDFQNTEVRAKPSSSASFLVVEGYDVSQIMTKLTKAVNFENISSIQVKKNFNQETEINQISSRCIGA